MSHAHELVLDIETAPVEQLRRLPPEQQRYLLERGSVFGAKEAADERLNLTPYYGKVIAIGLWLVGEDKGCALFEGEENAWIKDIDITDSVYIGDERSMLETLWKIVAKYPGRVVTWAGRTFDVPFLYVRSAVHGVLPSRNLLGPRSQTDAHLDLYEFLSFHGATRITSYSLTAACHAFGIDNPKTEMTGRDVSSAYLSLYERGEPIESIASYCMGDVRATLELYRRLQPLVGLMRG